MTKVRLKTKPDGSLLDFSTEAPDKEFRILSSWPVDGGLVSVIELDRETFEAGDINFEDVSEIRSQEVVHADEQTVLVQVIGPEPAPYRAGRESGHVPRFPLIVRDGWVIGETTTTPQRIAGLREELDSTDIEYEIVSVMQWTDQTELLTDRQRQFVIEAIEQGYYDSPRQCSLTALAERFEISKQTASGILHRAEGRIIKEFIGDSAG